MDGEERRKKIIGIITDTDKPVSASALGKKFNVSRQIIVGDIALLRATGYNITATNAGYLIDVGVPKTLTMSVKVSHRSEDAYDELCTIVDEGARIVDVYVEHTCYGKIVIPLNISNRSEARTFSEQLVESGEKTLGELTRGVHYHTIEADTQVALIRVQKALNEKGYLSK